MHQKDGVVTTHPVGLANLLSALARGGTIDPKTGEIIPRRETYQTSLVKMEMNIKAMQKAKNLTELTEIGKKLKDVGFLKSHLKKLREEYAYQSRKLKAKELTNQPKGNENED